jgi:hypothetical protein
MTLDADRMTPIDGACIVFSRGLTLRSMSHPGLVRRRLPALTALAASLVLASTAGAQTRALVLSEDFRVELPEAVNTLTGIMTAQGIVPEIRLPFPFEEIGDLEAYQCVFDLRVDYEIDPVIGARLIDHAERGRGLYMAGEHAVFAFRNDSVAGIVGLLGGGSVAVSPVSGGFLTPRDIVEPTNPDHPLSTDCNAVSEAVYDGIDNGQFINTGTGTWVSGTPFSAGMASWDNGALGVAPDARVVVALDINWLAFGTSGTIDWRVEDRTIPTQNRALAENLVQFLCTPEATCGGCEPRTHGFWHRTCLGWDAIDPGRNGGGNGPDPNRHGEPFDAALDAAVDGVLSPYGVGGCESLDDGPFSDERLAALRELATLQFNLKGKLLSTSCPVELEPVMPGADLDVGDALAEMHRLLSLGDEDSAKAARWIGEHVNNGEALIRR